MPSKLEPRIGLLSHASIPHVRDAIAFQLTVLGLSVTPLYAGRNMPVVSKELITATLPNLDLLFVEMTTESGPEVREIETFALTRQEPGRDRARRGVLSEHSALSADKSFEPLFPNLNVIVFQNSDEHGHLKSTRLGPNEIERVLLVSQNPVGSSLRIARAIFLTAAMNWPVQRASN